MAKVCANGDGRPVWSKKLCQSCWRREYGKPPKPISDKRKKQMPEYREVRDQYLEDHPVCEIQVKGCTMQATQVHHKAGRENERLTDVSEFCAACTNCHDWATENSKQAIEKGASTSKHKVKRSK